MENRRYIGLSKEQVDKSIEIFGINEIKSKEPDTFLDKVWGNFEDPIIRILCVALLIEVIFAFRGYTEWFEPMGIAIAVSIATLIAAWQEFSNESTFQKLQEDASKIICKVFRGGTTQEIRIDEVVVNDLIIIQTGDRVPADGILIQGKISTNQSLLNGETKECHKEAIGVDRFEALKADFNPHDIDTDYLNNEYVYRGTVVAQGEGVFLVKAVGAKTQMGILNKEILESVDRDSPLKVKLSNLAEKISQFGYWGGGFIACSFFFKKAVIDNQFDTNLISQYFTSNVGVVVNDLIKAVILALIIVVVAVPEGLPMMIAMVSSLNMRKLLKNNILVRVVNGIETAGSINILFTDKTGTITKGILEVISFFDGENKPFEKYKDMPEGIKNLVDLSISQNTSAMCNVDEVTGVCSVFGGNSTERALLTFANEEIMDYNLKVLDSIPFDSRDKYSATQVGGEYNLTLIKGASERIVEGCKYYYDNDGNKKDLTEAMIHTMHERIEDLANNEIRVIGMATNENSIESGKIFENMTLVGLLGIRDDLRPESKRAIKMVQDAGVQVVMLTGDKKETAVAIAKEAGLVKSNTDVILTSFELQDYTDEDLEVVLPNLRVVARSMPSDKSRLVRIAKNLDLVVGMTGDGVNDAPALKSADVGFAMGSGTEVSKEASEIVILDDNFNSIAKTILYGRTIFNSIRKFIVYQLTVNVAAITIAFVGPFLGVDLPLSMTQMLWVNLVMDTLAALSLGGEPAIEEYMREKPKQRQESIVSNYMRSSIGANGALIAIASLMFLKLTFFRNMFKFVGDVKADIVIKENVYFLTVFFCFFMVMNAFNMFNARTESTNLLANIKENKLFLKVFGTIVAVQITMTFIGGDILRTTPISLKHWIMIFGISFLIIPFDLIRKSLLHKYKATYARNV